MTQLIDTFLLFRLRRKGDAQAFGRLYDKYVSSIYRFVFLKLPSKEMAEDVTSETFLKCWQFIQKNQEPVGNFRAFLYKIARNLVVDAYRKAEAKPSIGLEETVTFSPSDTSSSTEASSSDVSDKHRGQILIEARADLALVLERISHLKEDYHDVLMLRLIDDLSFGDIAKVLAKTPGSVRVIYHRAMKALEALGGER